MKGKELEWGRGAPPPLLEVAQGQIPHSSLGERRGQGARSCDNSRFISGGGGREILESALPLLCKFLYNGLEGV